MVLAKAQNRVESLFASMPFILALWGVLVTVYMLLKFLPAHDYSGWVGFSSSIAFGIPTIYYLIRLWTSSKSTTKLVLGYLSIAFFCAFYETIIYMLTYNVLRVPHSNVSNFLSSLYNIPYTGYLALHLLAWTTILHASNTEKDSHRPLLYIPVIIISLACLSLLFFTFDISSVQFWTRKSFLGNFYNLIQTLLQIAGFMTALLCLAIAKSKGIFYLAMAYLAELTGDIIMNFGVFAQGYRMGSFIETLCILGSLLFIYGLIRFKKEANYSPSPKEWICKVDELWSQNALWVLASFTFFACLVLVLVGFISTAGFMENRPLQILVSISVFGLIVVAAIGNMLSKGLCSPIERMEGIINVFLPKKASGETAMSNEFNPISRFRRLESFMAKAFNSLEKDLAKEKRLSEITSVVAHDVRKPFTQLKSMLEVLPQLKGEEIGKYSEELDLTIHKVEAMLSDIMEYSRNAGYVLTPENVLHVLDLSIKDVSRYNPKKKVQFYYSLEMPNLINLDEKRLSRAFDNIIGNAFEAMPDENIFMWFVIKRHEENTKIIIGNSGSHIPEEQVDKLFENKFTSGKKSGTGLGLSITKKIIEGHKGLIIARNVGSAPNFVPENIRDVQGVEFEITLPVTEKKGYALKDPPLKNSQETKAQYGIVDKKSQLAGSSKIDALIKRLKKRTKKPTILILDDESIYRMCVKAVWDKLPEVKALTMFCDASNYEEAIDLLGHTKIDYLICDIDLTDEKKSGFDILKLAKKKYPNCRVIMHSNRKGAEYVNAAREIGACGFSPKPITEAIFVDLLLDNELWPDKRSELAKQKARKKTIKQIRAVPKTRILIVNDDILNLRLFSAMAKSAIDPKDNILFFTAENYKNARKIVDQEKPDIIISDYNLETTENGMDVCRYAKERNSKAIAIVYSGMAQSELRKLKSENKDWVDETHSTSIPMKDVLASALGILQKTNQNEKSSISTITSNSKHPDQALMHLTSCTLSTLYKNLDNITLRMEKVPASLDNPRKFKKEFAELVEKMGSIGKTHSDILASLENDKKMLSASLNSFPNLKYLLDRNKDGKLRDEYIEILHALKHDITANIIIVKNFVSGIEGFVENMDRNEIKAFAEENVIKLQRINEAVKTIKRQLDDTTLRLDTKEIKTAIKTNVKDSKIEEI